MNDKILKKLKIPDTPGVYFFTKSKKILYIGKATSLRDRVKSYFSKDIVGTRGPLIQKMLVEFNKIDFIKTDSVLEALILEAELIKKHQPYYNTKEKDDKSFNYVCITKEKLPKVVIVRGKELLQKQINFSSLRPSQNTGWDPREAQNSSVSSASIFGPYTNGSQLKIALQIIRKIFPFVDEASSKKANTEFYKQIHLTPSSMQEYVRNIKHLKLFLRGKKKDVLRNLKKEMLSLAKVHKFEQADIAKRQMFALQHINDIALLKLEPRTLHLEPNSRIEAYDIAHMGGKDMVGVMTVVKNKEVNKSEYKKFKIKTQNNTNDTGALKEVLERRLAHSEWAYPNLMVVDGGVAQLRTAQNILKKLSLKIPVVSVVKDERHKPKDILGDREFGIKYKREILLANSEAHRFAITYHKKMRAKNFLR